MEGVNVATRRTWGRATRTKGGTRRRSPGWRCVMEDMRRTWGWAMRPRGQEEEHEGGQGDGDVSWRKWGDLEVVTMDMRKTWGWPTRTQGQGEGHRGGHGGGDVSWGHGGTWRW